MSLRIRRGTELERLSIVPAEGELLYTTDQKRFYVGDGTTTGGNEVAARLYGTALDDIFLDTYHIYGTNLDINGNTGTITADTLAATNITTESLFANLNGSVFADDSTLLVDGINGKIVGPIYNSVGNVHITGGTNGQYLRTDGNGTLSWGSSSIANLSDVVISNATSKDILSFDNGSWKNKTISSFISAGNGVTINTTNGVATISASLVASGHLTTDINGSVFADDSTLLVDGIHGKIVGPVDTTTINTETLTISSSADTNDYTTFNGIIVGGGSPNTIVNVSRGTLEYPLIVNSGDPLLIHKVFAFDGVHYVNTAKHGFKIDPNTTPEQGKVASEYQIYLMDADGNDNEVLALNSAGVLSTPVIKPGGFATGSYPVDPVEGMIIFNTTSKHFMGYNGTDWVAFTGP